LVVSLIFSSLVACSVSTAPQKPLPKDDAPEQRRERGAINYSKANDSPEISRGVGQPDGIVVLWPRILPRTEDPAILAIAEGIQARLELLSKQSSDSVDRRPNPERVCPREGCKGVSVGAVLAIKDKGCAVVASVGPGGPTAVRLVPLAGTVELRSQESPFREPPENAVTVTEFVPCAKLAADLDANAALPGEAKLREAIAKARGK